MKSIKPTNWHIAANTEDQDIGAYYALCHLRDTLSDNGEHNSANKVNQYIEWIRVGDRPQWIFSDYKDPLIK